VGKAVIISEAGDGQYTISTSFDTTAAEVTLAKLQAILAGVQAEIDGGADDVRLILLNARKTALNKQITRISRAAGMTREMSAWCADLTTGLTGEVGTIEIGTEAANGVNIKPGYGGGQAYSPAGDGIETPFLTLPVSTAIMNFAVLPGIQKWRPTYRYGIVSNIDKVADTATVTVSACHSSIQNLDINQASVLNDVPVEYMACNAAAFEDGDAVIVKFEGFAQASPKVVGFKDHPKACGVNIKLLSINGVPFPGTYGYSLRLTQPIQTLIDHPTKGVYTEDFLVIGEGPVDSSGVAEIQFSEGVSIDPDYPIHVSIKNSNRWTYFSTDWRGSVPDRGYKWGAGTTGLTWYPADWATGGYDFLVDVVEYAQNGTLDLRAEVKESFQNASGKVVSGYAVAFDGIKLLQRNYSRSYFSNIETHEYLNKTVTSTRIKIYISRTMDYNDRYYKLPIYFAERLPVYAVTRTFVCRAGDSGLAFKMFWNLNPYAPGVLWQESKMDPFIKSDRSGRNLIYSQTDARIEAVGDYRCNWIWAESVGGYFCANPPRWDAAACQPGEGVDVSGDPCGGPYDTVTCTEGAIDIDESFVWEMVDLTE
jgi:hypothetical protein